MDNLRYSVILENLNCLKIVIQITLFLDIETPVTSELMKNKLNILTTLIIDNVFDNSEYFNALHKYFELE